MTSFDIQQQLEKLNADQLEHCTVCTDIKKYADYCLECREAVNFISDLYGIDEEDVMMTNSLKENCLYCETTIVVESEDELKVCVPCSGRLNDDPDFETYDEAWVRQKEEVPAIAQAQAYEAETGDKELRAIIQAQAFEADEECALCEGESASGDGILCKECLDAVNHPDGCEPEECSDCYHVGGHAPDCPSAF